jgi:hypothetical protein
VKITRNRKILVGLAIQLTSSAFYIVALGTSDRFPLPIGATYLLSVVVACIFMTIGAVEEKKKRETSSSAVAPPENN